MDPYTSKLYIRNHEEVVHTTMIISSYDPSFMLFKSMLFSGNEFQLFTRKQHRLETLSTDRYDDGLYSYTPDADTSVRISFYDETFQR
ncbi:hypothetical protein EVAR_51691_1 [Eumeta japonica]|uniref:Uncharacterized protein n=1 Tax=Eumeta variegata TaxID=151549 RepID=A0A4C1Y3B2_EUMVA|nr:hypothetical protein EVAR_51691_1 [Eumeta japonica]